MESDDMEHNVDNNGDDSSSYNCSDDLQEDQAKESNAGHSLQEDQANEFNASHNLQESQTKEFSAGHNATELKSILELSPNDILNMEFDSSEKAYEFYVKYARCVGFGVRKGDLARDDNGNMIRRKFVCNRAGLRDKKHYMRVDRKREHKPETRTNCNARLMISLNNKTSTWKVSKFEEGHNHELTPLKFVHLIPNHRRLADADKAQADSMHEYGIQTSQIMGFMAGQTGTYAGVDGQRHAKIIDGNALAAISYLQGKADFDPMMVVRYTTTDDGLLGNLFWADGLSRVDYGYFGDVVAFDPTYKKNKFNKPLVIFSGTNHHRQTCLFACALLVDERVDTYKWVLENFLDAMQKKQPSVVVADDDEAMMEAIKVVFPNATHRLCSSHLKINASYIKDSEFFEAFKKCIYENFDPDDFEQYWHNMIQKFKLSDNKWVEKIYKTKEMWATAYLRDKLYSGVRTTSRCEGISSFIKRFIKSSDNILELVQHFEHTVREYRNNEFVAEFNSMYSEPVMTTALESIERGAANVYTREIFKEVREELQGAAALFSVGCENIETTVIYKLNKYCEPGCEYKVTYDKNSETFDCQCRLWNTHGIPCSHIFCVMRQEHIGELPEKMILKRWTKDAKCYQEPPHEEEDSNKMFLLRYGALCAASNWMSYLAAKNLHDFLQTRDEICRITTKLEHKCSMVDTGSSSAPKNKVGHPVMVKTKDAPSDCENVNKKRRCSNCNKTGHAKRNCPGVKGGKSQPCEDLGSPSTSDDPPDAAPATNNKGEHNPIDSSASMMQSHAVKHAATTSGFGIRGSQFYPPAQTQPFYVGPHFNQFYPPLFYPARPDFIRPQGPVHQFVPQGVAQQQFVGHQQPGLAQDQNATNPSHQLSLQNMLGNPFMRK